MKSLKTLAAYLLVLVSVVQFIPCITAEAAPTKANTRSFLAAIDPPATGSIPISNREELAAISNNLSGKYHLVADIDLSDGEWKPIGTDNLFRTFKGVFDGQGFVIRNLTIFEEPSEGPMTPTYVGLFGIATTDAIIKNVGLANTKIVITETFWDPIYAGGICGRGGTISNCYNIGEISISMKMVSIYSDDVYVGGISGAEGTISNCYNTGLVAAKTAEGLDFAYAGGICGTLGSVVNCYNTGSISSFGNYAAYAGGICGSNSSVENSYNAGAVSAASNGRISISGGICGSNSGIYVISNCYNSGEIESYANNVAYETYSGGICGYSENNSIVRNSYWNVDSRIEDSSGEAKGLGYGMGQATALTTTQMQSQSSYTGWDFTSVWGFKPSINGGFPVLRAFHEFPSSWAEANVNSATIKGFVPPDLQSSYTDTITRLDFCRLAVKYMEYATGKSIDTILTEKGLQRDSTAFTDVTNTDVLAAYALGITSGAGDGKFNPNGQFTRESAAGMIMNLHRAMGYDVSNPVPSSFSDATSISSWTKAGVDYCAAAGIMVGSGGLFNPKGLFTREMSIMTFDNMG